ncbi:MAG TPA: YgiQ family radical SAM protein [Candidatus Faecousia intestinigallinarum]|nr:YgiQ family radical SAM protein [Candidatus Faecousia intestinigallinarum]
MEFLPISGQEMRQRGWDACDFVYVIGDAYVDHPSFGHAIISRVLEAAGYHVGIISQPDWKNPKSIDVFGRPRLGFLVSGGNMDSMVNHYTVAKRRRKNDAFTPGGVMGKRPDYATVVYCNLIRQTYQDVPILIGGVEASLRRLGHYDYWSEKLRRSILLDSQADILMYGMGERSVVELANALNSGLDVRDITYVDGTVYRARALDESLPTIVLPSFEELQKEKRRYAESFKIQYENCDPFTAKRLAEPYGKEFVVQNPPQKPLTTEEMDAVYDLPYCRTYHPSYEKAGGVPAIEEVRFSLVSNRGCFGACSFCALTFHQGRIVQTRSHASILKEAEQMVQEKGFKGYIHDVGGPTANFRAPACQKQLSKGACRGRQCLYPTPCKNLRADHSDYVSLLRKLRKLPGVKKVFVRSGIRFDYLLADRKDTFFRELVQYHVSGQLKVAPEHIADAVLSRMGKPGNAVYNRFVEKYFALCREYGKEQYLVPYLMSSHPGSTLKEAVELAEYIRDMGYNPEQVQDFYPTPSTLSTVMYYTGVDPRTMERVYVPTDPHEKAMQRALIQYRDPKNYYLVKEALLKAHREDLIGSEGKCLIRAIPPRAQSRKAPPPRVDKSMRKSAAGKSEGKRGKRR